MGYRWPAAIRWRRSCGITRDAIQFIHDQTVRQMNKGLVPDELVEAVKLPPHLAAFKPWMEEYSAR